MKKVAIISISWDNDTFLDIIKGVNEFIAEKDYSVDIFNAYDISDSKIRSLNELNIHSMPSAENYDALLLYTNSPASDEIIRPVIASFKQKNKIVICIDRKIDDNPSIEIDNYFSENYIMEHMISEHHCKKFQFVGGKKDYYDNEERFKAFKDCLAKYNIPCDERYISFHNFLESDGREAYRRIKEQNLPVPEAVICANDKMAVGYCLEAYNDGLYPPRDFLICGFDNINDGQTYFPSITSINKNIPQAFEKAFEYIEIFSGIGNIPEKTLITGFVKINESCGCNQYFDFRNNYRNLVFKGKSVKYSERKYRKLRLDLCSCRNFDEFKSSLKFAYDDIGLYEAAICVKNEIFENYGKISSSCISDSMKCYGPGFSSDINPYEDVRPAEWKDRSEKIFIYSPLYMHTDVLGYCVFPYHEGSYTKSYHESFIDSISIAVENIRQKVRIDNMNRQLKDITASV